MQEYLQNLDSCRNYAFSTGGANLCVFKIRSMLSVRISSYGCTRGILGEHEKNVRVARGVAERNCSFNSAAPPALLE